MMFGNAMPSVRMQTQSFAMNLIFREVLIAANGVPSWGSRVSGVFSMPPL